MADFMSKEKENSQFGHILALQQPLLYGFKKKFLSSQCCTHPSTHMQS